MCEKEDHSFHTKHNFLPEFLFNKIDTKMAQLLKN